MQEKKNSKKEGQVVTDCKNKAHAQVPKLKESKVILWDEIGGIGNHEQLFALRDFID